MRIEELPIRSSTMRLLSSKGIITATQARQYGDDDLRKVGLTTPQIDELNAALKISGFHPCGAERISLGESSKCSDV